MNEEGKQRSKACSEAEDSKIGKQVSSSHLACLQSFRYFLIFKGKIDMQNTQIKKKPINKNDLSAELEIKRNADIIESLRKGDGCKSSHFQHTQCDL